MVDRTGEIEIRLKAIQVSSEDTCIFFEKRSNTQFGMKRCFFCKYYKPSNREKNTGFCRFKKETPIEPILLQGMDIELKGENE